MLPLVSIVTPSFNQGHFIAETIESVLSQDYPNIEYWVIDGGSIDETVDVLRKYESDRRFHWISEKDNGQGDAVNKGWSRCRGDIIGWLNSDDIYLPDGLSLLARTLIADEGIDVICADAVMVREDGTPLTVLHGGNIDFHRLLRTNFVNQPTVLQRKKVIQKIGPLRPHLHYALDYDFYIRAALEFRFRYLPIPAATYRLHSGSKTTIGGSTFTNEMSTVVEEFFKQPSIPSELRDKHRSIKAEWAAKKSLSYVQESNYKEALRHVMDALLDGLVHPKMLFVPVLALDTKLNTRYYHKFFDIRFKKSTGHLLD